MGDFVDLDDVGDLNIGKRPARHWDDDTEWIETNHPQVRVL